jgi:TRAP transporter TAXI family solute receptor
MGCALRRVTVLFLVVLTGLYATGDARAQDKGAWLGLIAGPAAAAETLLAADMASLFPKSADLRVLPVLGDSGAGNLALLLDDPDIDLAFVSTDALAEASAKDKRLGDKLQLVARLAPQEVHVLARSEIESLSDLSGKKVSFGPAGSGTAVTATALFEALGVEVEVSNFDEAGAIEKLKQSALSAVVIVDAKPSPLIAAIPINIGLHLLPIAFGAPLEAAYLPTRLHAGDYANLIRSGSEVPTVATGMALLAAKTKRGEKPQAEIDHFVAVVFSHFAELQARHPKWREVNLAASLPGLKRAAGAEAWLAAQSKQEPIAASALGELSAMPEMSKDQREALFRRFIEWQRDKER